MVRIASRRSQRTPHLSGLILLTALLLWGCSGGGGATGGAGSPPPGPPPPVPNGTLAITTTSLPSGQVGKVYSATLSARGGTAPLAWSIDAGAPPAGLSLSASTGLISGTPTAAVSGASLTFAVTESSTARQKVSTTLPLTINPPDPPGISLVTTSLPSGRVGQAYSATLAATGGTPPLSWSLTAGALPAGLSLAATTGLISGTPTAAVSATSLTFTVTDSNPAPQQTSITLPLTINPASLVVVTTSLPAGRMGQAYSASLAATGGTPPLSWSLTAGALPAGLSLAASTGLISGTPTAAVSATSLTFTVTDSSPSPQQTSTAALPLTINPATITVSVSPARAGLTVTQTLSLAATTNDFAGVAWSITPAGGSFSPSASASDATVSFTAPSSAGVYTLTATSVTDPTASASLTVGVTDLAGVYTWHNDLGRDGVNAQEYALTPSNVNTATFGKLFSCAVDGALYAQPLWVANLSVGGSRHNVVFVATAHDSLYAFDADTSPCLQLWHVNLIDAQHGASPGETAVPAGTQGNLVGVGEGDISPEAGVIGTPVMDPVSNTLYVVSKSVDSTGTSFSQRLHAINATTGSESSGSPVTISATYPTTGGGSVTFSAQQQNQRPGLALVNGTVYIAWGSHEDSAPWYGWIMGYAGGTGGLTQTSALNVTPNTGEGGIWMSGGAPAADSAGNLYVLTGNGIFDVTNSAAPNNDYGDSFLQLTPALQVSSWFTPSDQAADYANDNDFGSGGAALVVNLPSGPVHHLVVGGGKDGTLYALSGDAMGGAGDTNAWQFFSLDSGNAIRASSAFWNNTLYIATAGGALRSFAFNPSTALFNTSPTSQSPTIYGFPGATPSISASGSSSNGIVWTLDQTNYCTPQSPGCAPVVLHAHNATNLAQELWNSTQVAADQAGYPVKFTVPTVANGKVYVGTRGNNSGGAFGSTSISGELDVYGLKPN